MLELQNISFGVTEDNGGGSVNKEILNNTGRQLLAIAVVLVICSFLLIVYIKRAVTKQYEKYGPYM